MTQREENITVPNPYESPRDLDRRPTGRNRVFATILAVVLLDVAFSAYKVARNLPDILGAPDSTAVVTGVLLVLWTASIAAELVAVLLIWRRRAAGRWILVASFGLKGIGQVGAAALRLPVLIRSPSVAFAGPLLYYAVQAICYSAATCWLILCHLESHAVRDGTMNGRADSDQSEK